MLAFIDNYLLTPYVQVVLFVGLLGLFWVQHRKFKLASSSFSWVRTILMLLLFVYFAWNWATSISQLITRFSVLGMLFINVYMIYNIILGNLDEKYRLALDSYSQNITDKGSLENVWSTGKKFVYARYFFDALFSGYSPGNFLKGIVSSHIPADIQNVLAKRGVEKDLITHQRLVEFLNTRLKQDREVPSELKEVLAQAVNQFGEHAWISDQVNEFLRLVLQDPEKLYHDALSDTSPEAK
jgi:hypothetical protein